MNGQALAVAATLLAIVVAPASADDCGATQDETYDASRMSVTYEIDLAECRAVPDAGANTMHVAVVRYDGDAPPRSGDERDFAADAPVRSRSMPSLITHQPRGRL